MGNFWARIGTRNLWESRSRKKSNEQRKIRGKWTPLGKKSFFSPTRNLPFSEKEEGKQNAGFTVFRQMRVWVDSRRKGRRGEKWPTRVSFPPLFVLKQKIHDNRFPQFCITESCSDPNESCCFDGNHKTCLFQTDALIKMSLERIFPFSSIYFIF